MHRKSSLAGVASKAVGWSFANNLVARLGTLAIGIVLARLLGPHAFGAFAVALVALMAVLSFNELGVSLAIVRWPSDPDEIAPTVATISVVSSVVIYAGAFFAAPAFARSMGAAGAATVIRLLSLNIIIDGAVATPAALIQRRFMQDRKMIADQVNNWLGAGVSIVLALKGLGAMSLAIGRLSGALAAGALFVAFSPGPIRFGFDRGKARALLRFGMPLAGASIVVFAVTNVDQLVVGRLLGASALGFYALAFNLASWPVNMFSLPLRNVAPALFARLQDDRLAMQKSFLASVGLLGSVTLPICLLIAGAAVPLIALVYGSRWASAAHALVWLAALAALRILFEFIYDYFVVLARSRVVFTVQIVWLVALTPALIVGTSYKGIAGAAMVELGVAALVIFPWYATELSRAGIRRRSLAPALGLPLAAGVGVCVVARVVAKVIANDFAACLASGLITVAVVSFLVYRARPALAELRAVLEAKSVGDEAVSTSSVRPARVTESNRAHVRLAAASNEAAQAAGLELLMQLSRAAPSSDITGPIPVYKDILNAPLYRDTARSLGMDPAERPSAGKRARDYHGH